MNIIPSEFAQICATTGFLTFFIKDLLEYIGVIKDKKTPVSRRYDYFSFEKKKAEEHQEVLKKFSDNVI